MKAKLEYDLNDPDDIMAHLRAVKSLDMASALFDILQLRKKLERRFENIDNTSNDVFDGIQEYADGVGEILENNGINIDELIN
jgi:hypothetical protein